MRGGAIVLIWYGQLTEKISILPNLRHRQLSIKDEVLRLKEGIFFANFQTILPQEIALRRNYGK